MAIVRDGRLVTVESVAGLREARARRIRLTFTDGQGARPLGGAERWAPSWQGDRVELLVPPSEVVGALVVGTVVFEALIVVVAGTIPPGQLFSAGGKGPPSAYQAFSGSTSYPGLLGAGLTHPFWIAMQLTSIGSLAAAAVAADVESGTVELVVVRPVSRTRLLVERTAALVARGGVLWPQLGVLVGAGALGLWGSYSRI